MRCRFELLRRHCVRGDDYFDDINIDTFQQFRIDANHSRLFVGITLGVSPAKETGIQFSGIEPHKFIVPPKLNCLVNSHSPCVDRGHDGIVCQKMKKHVVVDGECISSIAELHGFFPQTLWMHPGNASVRQLRDNPDVLLPEDIVEIPDLRAKETPCATNKRYRFRRKGVPARLCLIIYLDGRKPARETPYTLVVDDRRACGMTDAEGAIRVYFPPRARQATLTIAGTTFDLLCGSLNPVTEESGVVARLNNLGYETSHGPDHELGLSRAVRQFQEYYGLPATGEVDALTRARLVEIHGS